MSSLKIMVNGEPQTTEAETLEELCKVLGYRNMKVATALNGDFVPAARRDATPLSPEDRVEIVAPRQGG
jgi:sulfur carrier protein